MRTAAQSWVQPLVLVVLLGSMACGPADECYAEPADGLILKVVPYPQEVSMIEGRLPLAPPLCVTDGDPSDTEALATATLERYVGRGAAAPHGSMVVRLGSVEEGYPSAWLVAEQRAFLEHEATSPEASVLTITAPGPQGPGGITVVGKGKWGMLYGVQTINQLALEARRDRLDSLPAMTIRDWPDMNWRCLSPQLTWYSGWNRLEGYDCGNWSEDEWKWLADWTLLHKCNGWAVCMYGYWPFRLPGYEDETLDVDSFRRNPRTGQKEPWRFTHPNVKHEFYDKVIQYAGARGIKVHAYIGKNSFNGADFKTNPDKPWGGAAELIPFEPGVDEYWDAFLGKILDLGFDGFVMEDPETYHVPNRNEQCYRTFWEPWAKTYGFSSVEETNAQKPPLGVHVEYYTWLFRTWDRKIRKHASRLGIEPEMYLISHILMDRVATESQSDEELADWVALIDEKQGRKVPFVIHESQEARYVEVFGCDRVASLGGRAGSCTNAMRRIASINNNWLAGPMGGDIVCDISAQTRIHEAGGMGAMGYVFEWTNTEVFGYIAAQYLWNNAGAPQIDKQSQVDFLDHAYRIYYGNEVGHLAARAFDEGACINDAMVFEDVYGSQWPATGRALFRDHQYLAVLADRSEALAREAYRTLTGAEPTLTRPVYERPDFRWNGYDPGADLAFKSERLRQLWVSCRRSQHLCNAALAYYKAQRLIVEGAAIGEILGQYEAAIEHAEENQRIYQLNYVDDYDWTDGLCSRVTDRLKVSRRTFLAGAAGNVKVLQDWTFDQAGDPLGWTRTGDLSAPVVQDGVLAAKAGSQDPWMVQTQAISIPAGEHGLVEVEMASDRAGRAEVFWRTTGRPAFSEPPTVFRAVGDGRMHVYRVPIRCDGDLLGLRLDPPLEANIRIRTIRVGEMLDSAGDEIDETRRVPAAMQTTAESPVLMIPWEKQSDVVPNEPRAQQPGVYLSTDVCLDRRAEYFRLGVVFTVEAQRDDGRWEPVFRRGLNRRHSGWEHWDVPLDAVIGKGKRTLPLRFITDSYSRAQDRSAPSWKWAYWGQPQLVAIAADGKRRVLYDFVDRLDQAEALVRLDADGRDRPFDGQGEDSTGATFSASTGGPVPLALKQCKAGEGSQWQWVDGFADWADAPSHQGAYRHWLGSYASGWAYAHEDATLTWLTDTVPEKKDTAVVFVGSTDYNRAQAELWCNGHQLVSFATASAQNMQWKGERGEMRFVFGGDTRDEKTPYGLSGLFVVRVPAALITPGEPIELKVKLDPAGGSAWFMVHAYENAEEALQWGRPPLPEKPFIAAFTPHKDGHFGVAIGQYAVPLP